MLWNWLLIQLGDWPNRKACIFKNWFRLTLVFFGHCNLHPWIDFFQDWDTILSRIMKFVYRLKIKDLTWRTSLFSPNELLRLLVLKLPEWTNWKRNKQNMIKVVLGNSRDNNNNCLLTFITKGHPIFLLSVYQGCSMDLYWI